MKSRFLGIETLPFSKVIEKRQTRTDDIETGVLAMYAKGMSTRDIRKDHLRDI